MDALEALKTRRSVRSYKPDAVPKEIINDILDCGRLAATARNEQPWEFVVVTDAAMRKRIAETTDYGKFIADAPVCIVVLSEDSKYYLEDGSAATQNILVAARAHGLGSCWVAGDKKTYAPDICGLVNAPTGFRLVSLIALGYPQQAGAPSKRTLNEVVHWETF